MRMRRLVGRFALGVMAALTIGGAVAGCSEGRELSAQELKERYALALVEGISSGMNVIKASEVDRETLDLLDVRIEDGQRIIHAERCEILVNEREKTASLRLHGVVAVDAGKPARDDDGDPGVLIEMEGFTTEPIKIPGLARGAAGGIAGADHQ